jgi:peptidoglycan/LPS O-acetylase OafA/YrhL
MLTRTTNNKTRFEVLDGMRGIAALLVMEYHFLMRFPLGGVSRFFGNAITAVDFFFVLSGFVVSHAYAGKLRGGLSAKEYVIKRVARLYPLALAGMAIGFPVFCWGILTGGTRNYTVAGTVEILVSNLLLLPYFGGGAGKDLVVFPIDDPLWSIFFELFASVALIGLARQSSRRLAWIAGASYLGFMTAAIVFADSGINSNIGPVRDNFAGGFPRVSCSFVCGMLLYRVWQAQPAGGALGVLWRPRFGSAALLYASLIAALCCPFYVKGFYSLFVIIVAAPYLVAQGCQAQCRGMAMRCLSRFLGWMSYPVYCLHRPIGDGIALLHAQGFITPVLPLQAMAIIATLLTSALVSTAFDAVKAQERLGAAIRRLMPRA